MFKKPIFLFCIFFFIASFGILVLKVHVNNLSAVVDKMKTERARLNNEIQVLKAEWSYLNNSDRVSTLAKQHLGLTQIKSEQIKYLNPESAATSSKIMAENPKSSQQANINWQYKSRTGILKISNKKTNEDD